MENKLQSYPKRMESMNRAADTLNLVSMAFLSRRNCHIDSKTIVKKRAGKPPGVEHSLQHRRLSCQRKKEKNIGDSITKDVRSFCQRAGKTSERTLPSLNSFTKNFITLHYFFYIK